MNRTARLEESLARIFDGAREGLQSAMPPEEYEQRRHDFVFHMTDWKDDLKWLAEWFRNPDSQDEETASTQLVGFLYHVVPHLNEAGRLLLDKIDDPFIKSGGEQPARQ